jgi:hypothetical protein
MNLLSTQAGYGLKPHSCRPDPPRPRSPTRGGILVSPRLECVENGVGVLCEGDAADSKKELTVTPQAFMGSTRSSAMARSSRWWRGRQELMALDPQIGGIGLCVSRERGCSSRPIACKRSVMANRGRWAHIGPNVRRSDSFQCHDGLGNAGDGLQALPGLEALPPPFSPGSPQFAPHASNGDRGDPEPPLRPSRRDSLGAVLNGSPDTARS